MTFSSINFVGVECGDEFFGYLCCNALNWEVVQSMTKRSLLRGEVAVFFILVGRVYKISKLQICSRCILDGFCLSHHESFLSRWITFRRGMSRFPWYFLTIWFSFSSTFMCAGLFKHVLFSLSLNFAIKFFKWQMTEEVEGDSRSRQHHRWQDP
jgi:hypothetical protein